MKIFGAFILIFMLTGCSYVILPTKYYNEYTKISSDKNKDSLALNFKYAYVVRDTIRTGDITSFLGKYTKGYSYIFLYRNNLAAWIHTPIIINQKAYIYSEKEFVDSIKSGFFDKPVCYDAITWRYYKIEQNKFTIYSYDYNISSGANALTMVHTMQYSYLIQNGTLINKYSSRVNNGPITYVNNIYRSSAISAKPDSSKSIFIKKYNIYKKTGQRRHYPYYPDFEKYEAKLTKKMTRIHN